MISVKFSIRSALIGLGFVCLTAQPVTASNLLVNGDFEAAPILGAGQTDVAVGGAKMIVARPDIPGYANNISGVQGWTYALPHASGGHSDHGLARHDSAFGLPADGQSAFVNNWNRMMSQTVSNQVSEYFAVMASVDFGTLGSDYDTGRAGVFYLVAGEADPANPDRFSSRSIILDMLTVANLSWTGFTPDVAIPNGVYARLNLFYRASANDPALGLPLTIGFRTITNSVGYTYWDNADLRVFPVPEASGMLMISLGLVGFAGYRWRRKLQGD